MALDYSNTNRIKPLNGWGEKEHREVWRRVVGARAPDWFDEGMRPLIESYCLATVEERRCLAALAKRKSPGVKGYGTLANQARQWAGTKAAVAVKLGLAASQTKRDLKRRPKDAGAAAAADPGDWRGDMGLDNPVQ